MKSTKEKLFSTMAIAFTVCMALNVNTVKVKADSSADSQNGVELTSTTIDSTEIVIKAPVKTTTSSKTGSSKSSSSSNSSNSSGNSDDSAIGDDASYSGSNADLINYAKQFLGDPYVWGAEGPNSFDCSGFTLYVYKHVAGISLPHKAAIQATMGSPVSKANLQPGDLIFFDTASAGSGSVNHVGMYIGDGQFIQASGSQSKGGEVKISALSGFYANAYKWARRFR